MGYFKHLTQGVMNYLGQLFNFYYFIKNANLMFIQIIKCIITINKLYLRHIVKRNVIDYRTKVNAFKM
jgi:hypothetical protein